MSSVSIKIVCGCALMFWLVIPFRLHAQASAWGAATGAKKEATKTKGKLKNLKDHIEKWGLDSSYNRAFLLGGKINTDGWSGCVWFVKRKNYTNNIWQISFSEIRHEKQTKQKGKNTTFPELGNATPYVFGKINNLYTLQVGFGKEKILLPGVMEGNLSVSYRYNTGLSLAMLKPYYLKMLQVDYTNSPPIAHILQDHYTHEDSAQFLNDKLILGASTWSKGLDAIDFVPGAYLETALAITPGKHKTFVQQITLGLNAALYYKPLPIMQGQQAYPWQVCLFAGVGVGKRW